MEESAESYMHLNFREIALGVEIDASAEVLRVDGITISRRIFKFLAESASVGAAFQLLSNEHDVVVLKKLGLPVTASDPGASA